MIYAKLTVFDSSNPSPLELLEWKICITVLHGISFASTTFRIWYRYHIRRLWWDDYSTVLPTILEIVYLVTLWLRVEGGKGASDFISNKLVLYWLSAVPYTFISWSARVCLVLSIARVFPPGASPRRFALILAAMFSFTCLAMTTAKIATSYVYGSSSRNRHNFEQPHCGRREALCIAGFIFDIIADIVLTISPLFMLWHVKLPRNQRRLILALFSASALTLIVACVYILCVFSPISQTRTGPVLLTMMPYIEAAVSVLVCNLSVIVSCFYRTFRQSEDNDTATLGEEVPTKSLPVTVATGAHPTDPSLLVLTTILSSSDPSIFPNSQLSAREENSTLKRG